MRSFCLLKKIGQIKIYYVNESFQCVSYPNKEFVYADEEGYLKDDRKFWAFFPSLLGSDSR